MAVSPCAGARFRLVVRMPVEGTKRRKLLALIAAYQDADPDYRPSIRELGARMDIEDVRALDAILDRLARDGWLTVRRSESERNQYTLRLDGRK